METGLVEVFKLGTDYKFAKNGTKATESNRIYAVGAMTRGQIIDASTARGIVRSTERIATRLVDELKQVTVKSAG